MRQKTHKRENPKKLGKLVLGLLLGCGLCFVFLALTSCRTAGPASEVHVKNGKAYGVTRGLFRGRWWNYYERGVSFADGGFWEEAEKDLRTAVRLRSDDKRRARTYGLHFVDYFPHRELGAALYHQGRYREAVVELETSLEMVKTAKAEYYLDLARKARIDETGSDMERPSIRMDSPAQGTVSNKFLTRISGTVTDDTFVREVLVNGVEVRMDVSSREVSFDVEAPLKGGENTILVAATDLTGKTDYAERIVRVDRQGPVVQIDEVAGRGALGEGLRIRGCVYDDLEIAQLKINGEPLLDRPVQEFSLDRHISGPADLGKVTIEAVDGAGNKTEAVISPSSGREAESFKIRRSFIDFRRPAPGAPPIRLAFLNRPGANLAGDAPFRIAAQGPPDEIPPRIELKGWRNEQTVFLEEAYLEGQVTDDRQVDQVFVNGSPILQKPGRNIYFSYLAKLEEGENPFRIRARDPAGNDSRRDLVIVRKVRKLHDVGSRMTVVLFPLDRKGPGDGGGALLEDMLLGSLLERRRFEMVERERLEALLREARLSRSDLADPSTAVRLGRILAAEAVLIGSILQKEGSLDIFVRLVDTETTLILTAVDVYGEDVDSRLMRKLCRGLVLKLCDEVPLLEGLVVKVDGEEVIVNLGEETKLKKGMRMIVFEEGEPLRDPVTGRSLGSDVEERGKARIERVRARVSHAEVVERKEESAIKPMMKVITQ